MLQRFLSFLAVAILGIFATPLVALPLALWYATRWYALELILLGYVFDTYFGAAAPWPYYTLGSGLIVVIAEAAKRYLLLR